MTVENISWSISTKECCRPWRGLNPRPPGLQLDGTSRLKTVLLVTNSLAVVAKVFSKTFIFLLQKCKSYSDFFSKNINVFAIFQDTNFNVTLANNFVKF